jgi:cell division septal protein FtsQ
VIDERIAQRRAGVRDADRRRRLRRTVRIAAVLVVLATLVGLERSSLVALEEVTVLGLDRLDAATVLDVAALPIGSSVARARLGAVEDRIERLPLVRSVTARRTGPRQVRIEVIERLPVLVVEGNGAERLVDRDGVVIAEGRLEGLPVVVLRTAPPGVGAVVSASPTLANAHLAWRGLSGPLRATVERYLADGPDDLTLVLRSGIEVRFGRAERVDEKVRALGAVLADIGDTPVGVIDVRAPGAPVIVAEAVDVLDPEATAP